MLYNGHMKLIPDVRPYWHVDAKWIFGILLSVSLTCCLLLSTVSVLTEKNQAPQIVASVIGANFIRDGAIDIKSAEKAIDKAGGALHPIPFMPSVVITKADLKLTPEEISLKVFLPVTEIIYDKGVNGAADQFAKTKAQREQFIQQAAFLQPFTASTHQALQLPLIISYFLTVLFTTAVVYFSAGWGRLSNLGFILFTVSAPGTLFSFALLNPPHDGKGGFESLPTVLTHAAGSALSYYYLFVTVAGALLMLAALIGKIATVVMQRRNQKNDKNKTSDSN